MLRLFQRRCRSLRSAILELEQATEDEVRQLRRQLLVLEAQATTDFLTGTLSLRAILEIAETEIARRDRSPTPLALALIDLDHLRAINEKHKHPAGDQALLGLAHALKSVVRREARVGRCGGDEFMLIGPNTDAAAATALGERIRSAVENARISSNNQPIVCTASIGFAVAEAGKADLARLRHVAAEALAEAKNAGRNRCVVKMT